MNVLCISVHPDDETLGCGGMLYRHKAQGDTLDWLIVTQAHEPQWPQKIIEAKALEVEAVAQAYGIRNTFKLGFPTTQLDITPQANLMNDIRNVIDQAKPNLVYLVHAGDVHTDHHAVFEASLCVLKTFYMQRLGVQRVLCYETLSSTDAAPPQLHRAFLPNVYCDITPYLKKKIDTMKLYESEIQPEPFPRSDSAIEALARFRGSAIGVQYAECFMLMREVI